MRRTPLFKYHGLKKKKKKNGKGGGGGGAERGRVISLDDT